MSTINTVILFVSCFGTPLIIYGVEVLETRMRARRERDAAGREDRR